MAPTRIDAAKLLAEAGWVRRLALRLVRDSAEAEDVVQETWLAALRSPAPDGGRLRPWLARVVLNFARRSRRGEARRARREHDAARPERLPPASEALERLEAQRLLVDAIEALEEPYRLTVILRHVEGLSAEEIARRQHVPAGTVRWRLKKGVDELRARLDARHGGDRGAWALALVPLLHRPPLGEVAIGSAACVAQAVVSGGLAMNVMTKVGVAAAIVLTAVMGVWIATEPPRGEVELQAAATPAATPEVPASNPGALVTPEAPGPDSRTSAVAPAAAPEGHAAPAPANGSGAEIDARFLDRYGRPVQGVQLALAAFPRAEIAPSGADGRVVAEIELDRPDVDTPLTAARAGFATYFDRVTIEPGRTYLGDVRLEPGGSISGRVLAPDGSPQAQAEVAVFSAEIALDSQESRVRGPGDTSRTPTGRTDASGGFRLDGVRAGLVRVWACGPESRWAATEPVDVPAGGLRGGIEIRLLPLEREDMIEGIVLAPDGTPIAGAEVRYVGHSASGTWSGNFSAGEDGRFRHRVPTRGLHGFVAHDRESRWADAGVEGVPPGTHDVVLQFAPQRWLEVAVRARPSQPIEEFAAAVLSADRKRTIVAGRLEVHADGRVRVLVPGETFLVQVSARGHGVAELGPWTPATAPAFADCTLQPRPGVRGRVLASGEPVAGARVGLYEMAGEHTRIESNGFLTRLHPRPADETTTDADGWFELDPNRTDREEWSQLLRQASGARGTFAILCEGAGWALGELSPLDFDPSAGMDGLEVVLVRGGAIEGRVRTAPGRDPAGTVVVIDRCDGKPHTVRVGPEGAYRFENLAPGRWNVTRAEQEVRPGSWSTSYRSGDDVHVDYASNCTVADGQTTRFDLDLSDDRPCVLVAHVAVNGADAEGWTGRLNPKEGGTGRNHPGGAVDAGGMLRIETDTEGEYELELAPPAAVAESVTFVLPVTLRRGENPLPIAFGTGRVTGRLASPAPDRILQATEVDAHASGIAFQARTRPAADGAFTLPIVLAGAVRVCVLKEKPDGGSIGPLSEVRADVTPGGAVDVTVP